MTSTRTALHAQSSENENERKRQQRERERLEERLQREAEVTERREHRLMGVEGQITSEIERGRVGAMEYGVDSPFWWWAVKEREGRIRRLSLRLNTLCDGVLDLCSVAMSFSEHCGRIANLVSVSWEDVEAGYFVDILSLNGQFKELGEQLAQSSNAAKQLAVTMKAGT